MSKYNEWLSNLISNPSIGLTVTQCHDALRPIRDMAYSPNRDHIHHITGTMISSVARKVELVGLSSLAEMMDTDHKKAVLYGMMHTSESLASRLVRRPSHSSAQTLVRTYVCDFLTAYCTFASTGEQSIIKPGDLMLDAVEGHIAAIRRVPTLDASTRLRYQSSLDRVFKVLRIQVTGSSVLISLKPNLMFSDFYGINDRVYSSTRFSGPDGSLNARSASLFALTKPLLHDLMCLTRVVKTIRRLQYEHNN